MNHPGVNARRAGLVGISTAALILAACENERTAEAETPVSEAEVSTDLPNSVISEERLEATANAAAQVAATPPAQVIAVPSPAPVQTQQGADAAASAQERADPAQTNSQ